ncbi:hypothetical protein, variant [Verruconis gallopava]|uniref:Inhibitor I9 domain-containing protein n=1 Tax=Verruconis gallopava TaxID=253628 RepID=A0A0D1ZX55_9PEZI|nr:uncharacterized protein PV09_09577 [Verruconis gallopava]XP_016208500.1 hypothetical protein, variant [Verruconis gallopava]KIV98629.1 hypothetical protein PV09_09577 [Verruconis gallopava]KIV98630.1 hypothetical protein, variant [Verruconis gallopava]
MQFLRNLLLALFGLVAIAAAATQPQKSVIMTWSSDTPSHIIDQAKEAILKAGGIITHEYRILKGFAATASAKTFEMVSTLSTEYPPSIEEDQVVTINEAS